MLTVTRKDGEAIQIGDTLLFIQVQGGKAKLHIEAPADVRILRGEIAGLPTFANYMRQHRRQSQQDRAAG